jgi:hypothetical protein
MEVSGQLHAPASLLLFIPGEIALGISWLGHWVGVRPGLDRLDVMEKRKFLPMAASL